MVVVQEKHEYDMSQLSKVKSLEKVLQHYTK